MSKKASILFIGLIACGNAPRPSSPPSNVTPSGSSNVPSSSASSSATGAAITLEWIAVRAKGNELAVTAVIAGTPFALGEISNAPPDPATPMTCRLGGKREAKHSEFSCGEKKEDGRASFNYAADLQGNELVITLHSWEYSNHTGEWLEDTNEVKRVPVVGASLTVAPYQKSGG
jgi:hypothetical protein